MSKCEFSFIQPRDGGYLRRHSLVERDFCFPQSPDINDLLTIVGGNSSMVGTWLCIT